MKSETKDLSHSQSAIQEFFFDYIIHPLNEGFFGFGIFLAILTSLKFFSFLFGMSKSFTVDEKDLILSSVGFICLFLIDILKKFEGHKN